MDHWEGQTAGPSSLRACANAPDVRRVAHPDAQMAEPNSPAVRPGRRYTSGGMAC